MTGEQLALVREVEELAYAAWPAAEVVELDGWRLRFTDGVTTRRARSVWPNADTGRLPLAEKLARVEAFYAGHGMAARYQMCAAAQPPELDALLAERGYREDAHTAVEIAPLADVVSRSHRPMALPVNVAPAADDAWLATYCGTESVPSREAEARRSILLRLGAPTGYAILTDGERPRAVGLGVLERDWLGIFCMATDPAFRRRGAATDILQALAHWGQQHGATHAYLQVMCSNDAARALYARLGFRPLYEYHYREAPASGARR
jgi:ribosomal protein S18 acetylase RimI-like enzyme